MDVSFSRFFYFFAGLDRIKESVKPVGEWGSFPSTSVGRFAAVGVGCCLLQESLLPILQWGFLCSSDSHSFRIHQKKKKYITSFFECDTSFEARKKKVIEADNWKRFPQNIEWIIHWISSSSREAKHRTEIPFLVLSVMGKGIFPTQGLKIRKKRKNFFISSARFTTYSKFQKTSISKESHAIENAFHGILQELLCNSGFSSSKSKWK